MHKLLQPESPVVRYGTSIASAGRMAAYGLLKAVDPTYAMLGFSSNATGLLFSHNKTGFVAESALACGAMVALGAHALHEGNYSRLWTAGVGALAFGNAFFSNVRYSKFCPQAWRLQEKKPELPKEDYAQTVKTEQVSFLDKILRVPGAAVKWGAEKLQASEGPLRQKFGETLVELSQRRMFSPAMLALVGITPFIADGINKGAHTGDWKQMAGGLLIALANVISSASMPQKQNHPLVAAFNATRDVFAGKKDDAPRPARNADFSCYGCE